MAGDCCSMQLVNEEGFFHATGLDNFVQKVKMAKRGNSYVMVSIMGPQSSGKSTLVNHLFGTKFTEMDASRGRSQTTKGIWLAKCVNMEPFTIVVDIEGSDGRERGEDDTTFEKQSALFALAVSDIVLINMWCHEIGREQAANKPLLRTVFQVMLRLFALRKTTLLFVVRDKTETPPEQLEDILRTDIQKIWDNVPKPEAHNDTRFGDFFSVEFVFLSHYRYAKPEFMDEVASLRQKFYHSTSPGGLAGDRRGVVPASGFAFSTQQIWKVIKENKDLDLPAHKVMVATVRCEQIANEKLSAMTANENWLQVEEASQHYMVPEFGNKLNKILDECLSGYDTEAIYFDEAVRTSKRKELLTKLLQKVHPAYKSIVGHIRSKTLNDFKEHFGKIRRGRTEGFEDAADRCAQFFLLEFDKRVKQDAAIKHVERNPDGTIKHAEWNPSSKVRDKLARDIKIHVASVRAEEEKQATTAKLLKMGKIALSLMCLAGGHLPLGVDMQAYNMVVMEVFEMIAPNSNSLPLRILSSSSLPLRIPISSPLPLEMSTGTYDLVKEVSDMVKD